MKSIFDEEDELLYKQVLIPIMRRVVKQSTVFRSPPPRQFTRADITKIPTSETMWGGRSTLPMTDRDRRLLKLRAMRGVMY
jgi:hypothetical protein